MCSVSKGSGGLQRSSSGWPSLSSTSVRGISRRLIAQCKTYEAESSPIGGAVLPRSPGLGLPPEAFKFAGDSEVNPS
eukprot:282107-Hanusia_phi.AAC.1